LFKTTVWTHRLFTSFLSLSISTSPNFQAFATDRVGKTRCRLQQFVSNNRILHCYGRSRKTI
ncbi:MAG: hypothetical protein AAF268_07915, partial [Cyanobacteria bacterium P01_A01_bin.3]